MKCEQQKESTSSQTKTSTWVVGAKTDFMEMEFTSIPMEINLGESLNKVLKKEEESTFTNLELFMMESGKMIKRMVKELLLTQTNKYIQGDG